jgi:ATP-dependent helicase HrpB
MSATIGPIINKLREYFWNCKVISVPGRTFPIETRLKYTPKGYEKQYDTMARHAIDLAEEDKNVMIFLPGKGEIETFQNILKYKDHKKIYLLHAEMERDAQNETLSASVNDKGIIVLATNVAETSITPDGIDVVIDSGQERIKISNNGIPKISLIDISYHKAKQRKGRVGRTKPGIYIDYGTSYKPEEDTPEILREDLSSLYLSMLNNDIKMEEAIFFNNPGINEVRQAKVLVEILGFVKDGELTEEGMIAIQLGTTCRASKIIIEANKRNITNDGILMALLMEISLLKHDCKIDRIKELLNYKKYNSDILAYMDIFRKIQKAINEDNQVVINNLRNIGIKLKAYFEIINMGQKLEEKIEQLFEDDDDVETTENIILDCILASFPDRIYNKYRYKYTSNDGKLYILDNNSFVSTFDKIVGVPVQRGGYLIITNATNAGRNT